MSFEMMIDKTKITLIQGDITEQEVDAIVNAANSTLLGGGGVDGAIHRAGGPRILEECREIVANIGSCPTGEAVITTGGDLKARHVIHTVGPIWQGGNHREDNLLENAYRHSLELAKAEGIASIAFPSISTGAYRFPLERAAEIALKTIFSFVKEKSMDEVRLVLFSETDFEIYKETAGKLGPTS